MDDSKIIELFFERSEQAIVELSKKYGKLCLKTANNILKNESDAEECVNDAWFGVWNSIPPQEPEYLLGYILKIVRNNALKRYNYNTAEKRNNFYDVVLDELEECIADPKSGYEEDTLANVINNFLSELDKNDRIMFVKRYFYAEPVAEIAHAFGKNAHYVSVRLSRIRNKLKIYLKKEDISI